MFAVYAVMFTIRLKAILMAVFLPEHLLKNCRKIGHVLFAGRPKMNFRQSK